jgi:hypothetical protein
MTWEDFGIVDPNIKWQKFESTGSKCITINNEIICFIYDLLKMEQLGLWKDQIKHLMEWAEYIEILSEDAIDEIILKRKREIFDKTLSEFSEFRDAFDQFAFDVKWYSNEKN